MNLPRLNDHLTRTTQLHGGGRGGGYNVYPREIETHLLSHPGLALAACLGRPDPVLGEVGVANVAPRPAIEISRDEIPENCRAGLAEHKILRSVEIRPALPLTALGKVDKQALRREPEPG